MWDYIIDHFNYWIYITLMMIGLYAMITKNNLIKKLIGMSIFQTAIMLFYVSIGAKEGGRIPILEHVEGTGTGEHLAAAAGSAVAAAAHGAVDPAGYTNPLPHVLMLTAIVVGVGTMGVAMAVVQKIYRHYGSLEEDEIMAGVRA